MIKMFQMLSDISCKEVFNHIHTNEKYVQKHLILTLKFIIYSLILSSGGEFTKNVD